MGVNGGRSWCQCRAPQIHLGQAMIWQAPKVWLSQEDRDGLERFARSRTLPIGVVSERGLFCALATARTIRSPNKKDYLGRRWASGGSASS